MGYNKALIERIFCILKGKGHKINAKKYVCWRHFCGWNIKKTKMFWRCEILNYWLRQMFYFLPHPIDRVRCKQSNQVIHSNCCILHSSQLLSENYTGIVASYIVVNYCLRITQGLCSLFIIDFILFKQFTIKQLSIITFAQGNFCSWCKFDNILLFFFSFFMIFLFEKSTYIL